MNKWVNNVSIQLPVRSANLYHFDDLLCCGHIHLLQAHNLNLLSVILEDPQLGLLVQQVKHLFQGRKLHTFLAIASSIWFFQSRQKQSDEKSSFLLSHCKSRKSWRMQRGPSCWISCGWGTWTRRWLQAKRRVILHPNDVSMQFQSSPNHRDTMF